MSNTCEVITKVTIDSLALMGEQPMIGTYICATAVVYIPPSGPAVCGTAAGATAIGKYLQSEAAKGLAEKAMEMGCDVVLTVGDEVLDIAIVKGRAMGSEIKQKLETTKAEFRAATTNEGIMRLMNRLAGR